MNYILYRNGQPVDIVTPNRDAHGKLGGWCSVYQPMTYGLNADDRIAPAADVSASRPAAEALADRHAPPAEFTLSNVRDVKPITALVEADSFGFTVSIPGYGTHGMEPGHGPLIYVELADNGHPVLHVWADINSEDATHTIDLGGAAEVKRGTAQRWAFSHKELEVPHSCNAYDDLVAFVPECSDGIIVQRCGEVSNRYADGTKGVNKELRDLAGEVETLSHPDADESTAYWRDVLATADGAFIKFIDN